MHELVTIGMVAVTLGLIGLIWGIIQKVQAGRVMDAPLVKTGDAATRGAQVASPKGALSVEGAVQCGQPLTAPVSGEPCLWFHLKSTVSWKDGDEEKSKVIDDDKQAAVFAIDDGSGPIAIEAKEGGGFDPVVRKTETKKVGLVAGITGTELRFGNYIVKTGIGSMEEKYEVEEAYMPLTPRMYACGKLSPTGAIAAPGWRSLILSNKSRDELLGSSLKTAKMSLIGGGAAFAVGSIMAIVGNQMAPAKAPEAATTTAAAAAAPGSPAKKAPATVQTKVAPKK